VSTNDFGGGFDASDEATKVAAPPLAALPVPVANVTNLPIGTGNQPTDGIGVRLSTQPGVLYHPLGTWNAATGTTDAVAVALGARTLNFSAGTQPVDSQRPVQ
jgi:hypothetical protein